MDIDLKLKELRKESFLVSTLYEKTLLDYEYMTILLNHVKDLSFFRPEIQAFQQLHLTYNTVYIDPLYGEFLVLLQKLMDKMD